MTYENGLRSLLPHTASDSTPFTRTTRNISRRPAIGSGKNIIPSRLTAVSKRLSSNGSESAEHCWNSTLVSPRRRASVSAVLTICATASVQVTEPAGATTSAIESEGSPAPPATSITFWPGPMPASAISARVSGANMVLIVGACFSQCGAVSRHSFKTSVSTVIGILFLTRGCGHARSRSQH